MLITVSCMKCAVAYTAGNNRETEHVLCEHSNLTELPLVGRVNSGLLIMNPHCFNQLCRNIKKIELFCKLD
jgi:hypothetical protein